MKAKISRDTGVPESTLRSWWERRRRASCKSSHRLSMGQKDCRKKAWAANDEQLDKAMLTCWFVKEQSQGNPLSGPIMRHQAEKFHHQLHGAGGERDFIASKRWLQHFQKRHGLGAAKMQGKQRSADTAAEDFFLAQVKEEAAVAPPPPAKSHTDAADSLHQLITTLHLRNLHRRTQL
ncbi:unnamed protein product [Acanthosepion pharaonis]|uniref:HTH CENPB-type domain-containing protein n=1 Tax=Acanthosepion pharaonis TaxID=158019 RepID=A0A812B7D9_ACAPH|nr:unnamed protein product [Sepia pharaonis]